MTKIISTHSPFKNQYPMEKTNTINKKKNFQSLLLKVLKRIINSPIQLKKAIFVTKASSFSNKVIYQGVNTKVVRDFIAHEIVKLDLKKKCREDHVHADQACDAVLAAVFSNKKDAFCKEMIANGGNISGYLIESGDLARSVGLEGKMDEGKFVPSGAGANPFLSPIISPTHKKFRFAFKNKNQQVYFKKYIENKISKEVGEICNNKGKIHPDKFSLMLEGIAKKHLQGKT